MNSSSSPKTNLADLLLTALAPIVWGSSYIFTTRFLPDYHPVMVAALRALPAGILLLLLVRRLPQGVWIWRCLLLGALNFTIFWILMFISAYRLPGGVAATIGAIQPLFVVALSVPLLKKRVTQNALVAACGGLVGVAFLTFDPNAQLDLWGVFAAVGCAVSMAFGTVLSRKWQPPVSALTFTAWQLMFGGILLLPLALFFSPVPYPTWPELGALVWLGLVGAAFAYILWFRGLARLEPAVVTSLGFLSPTVALIIGWLVLGQSLSFVQMLGFVLVLGSIWYGQRRG